MAKVFYSCLIGWTEHFCIYLHKNQKTHQNYQFIVMLSQMLLHVLAHHRHHQGAHTILRSYLSVYIIKNLLAQGPCSTTAHCFQQQLTISTYIHSAKLLIGATSLDIPLFFCNVHLQVARVINLHSPCICNM
jgi:hypothetical protein